MRTVLHRFGGGYLYYDYEAPGEYASITVLPKVHASWLIIWMYAVCTVHALKKKLPTQYKHQNTLFVVGFVADNLTGVSMLVISLVILVGLCVASQVMVCCLAKVRIRTNKNKWKACWVKCLVAWNAWTQTKQTKLAITSTDLVWVRVTCNTGRGTRGGVDRQADAQHDAQHAWRYRRHWQQDEHDVWRCSRKPKQPIWRNGCNDYYSCQAVSGMLSAWLSASWYWFRVCGQLRNKL